MRFPGRRRSTSGDETRIENSLLSRASMTTLLIALVSGVAVLLIIRRWADTETALVIVGLLAAALIALFMSPQTLVIDRSSVRDESGWRRTGWVVDRSLVDDVVWERDPDFFEPPHLCFIDADGAVLRRVTVEFDMETVAEALQRHGWPLTEH